MARLLLRQKSRIKSTRQQIGDVKRFALAVEIRKHDRRAFRKLPDDLTASAAGRRQSIRIGNNGQRGELSLTFRQRFPDRYSFGANCQTITRALDVASGVDLAAFSSHCRTDKKIRKWRDRLQSRTLRRFNQRL